jgi:Cathepsin propeptide inhibitor domain (I29)
LRKYIFYENKRFVEANNGLDGVSLEMNKFGDMLHSEFVDLYMGYKRAEQLDPVEK